MIDVLIDAIKDTLLAFIVILLFNFIFSFVEGKIANKFSKRKTLSVLFGSFLGLVPQCGFSIIAADMYSKKKISIGTIIAIFIACSDEAIPLFLSNLDKAIYLIPLLIIKFILAFIIGICTDLIYYHFVNKKDFININDEENITHHGCCHHDIEEHEGESKIKQHLIHPLLHSLKLIIYIFVINIIFGLIIYFIGEDNIANFISKSYYFTPLFATLVGLIPNCASSIIICELYLSSVIPFSSVLAGLMCNAGLGLVYLFKNKKDLKNNLLITIILIGSSLFFGYLSLLIETLIAK